MGSSALSPKMKAASDAKLATLKPAFRAKVEELLVRAEDATNLPWIVICGGRTLKEQAVSYAIGRDKAGNIVGKVVTMAPPGFTPHNYRLGADLGAVKDGKICWDLPLYKKMADEAKKLGLVAGYYFKKLVDGDHVEDPNWRDCMVTELPALAKEEGVRIPQKAGERWIPESK